MSRLDPDQWQPDPVSGFRPPQGVEAHGHDAANIVNQGMPVGVVNAYWGTTAPTGWLLCDGAAIPAQYPRLIALVGANTPNLKGKVVVGVNGADADFDVVGYTGGAKTVTIASGNLPVHTHGLNSHTHSGTTGDDNSNHQHTVLGGTGGQSDNHSHQAGVAGNAGAGDLQGWPASNVHNAFRSSDHGGGALMYAGVIGGICQITNNSVYQDHTHTFSATSDATLTPHDHDIAGDSGNTTNGGFANTAAAIVQPFMALSYIIKAA